jgi:diaminopimelate decarboxylase/aspartate kinase
MKQQVITKFGGTSVSSRENWDFILEITKNHLAQHVQPIIVCSALTQASNQLEKMIEAALMNAHEGLFNDLQQQYVQLADALEVKHTLISADLQQLQFWLTGIALLKQAPEKIRASVLSLGELMMTRLGHAYLKNQGIRCEWFDVRQALVSAPVAGGEAVNYLAARCPSEPNPALAKQLADMNADVIITQGFIAANTAGETVLLGRGGSDTSAGLLAAVLQTTACEIWTDVPGIYSANPHQLPHARLLKQLDYDEAQEIASMGAKVLHPNCIPPVKRANLPLYVKYTKMPGHSGTCVSHKSDEEAPLIKSIQVKHNVILITIDTLNMWQQVGFLADVFVTFKTHGFSVDLLSSSEFNVTLSLDSNAKLRDKRALDALITDLNAFGRARVIESCSAVSLVGHQIRTVLPQLGPTLEVFEGQQVYLMSLASNDLNITFVVNELQADKICQKLHALLIENNPQGMYYSKSFQEEFGQGVAILPAWWEKARDKLLSMGEQTSPCYVYNTTTVKEKARQLGKLKAIDQLFYAVKANPHPDILQTLFDEKVGFECVSIQELELVLTLFPEIDLNRLLFTPNFASKQEYEHALKLGCHVTVDSLYPLEHWPALFHDRHILLRVDPGSGAGHHKYVCTGGNESKFGIPLASLEKVALLAEKHRFNVIGLHAHSGSGILTVGLWQQTAMKLVAELQRFPQVRYINVGGGLGVVEKPAQQPLDLQALDASLLAVKSQHPQLTFWLEPGRFLVAESGVMLAKVTQMKEKGKVKFIGIETGMNSLLRPALYGAYHEIVNLTRLHEKKCQVVHVVGPICESGDTLGYDRLFPSTEENDLILIANTGAYGHCMSSFYNLRPPAIEVIF